MSAALTTPGARNVRPSSILAAVLATALLVVLVALVGSRLAALQGGTSPVDPMVGGSAGTTGHTGIPYVGTGPAADLIRGGATTATTPLAVPATTGDLGIPYVGTGPTADKIRAASIPATTDRAGIPYVGTGPAADRIRGGSTATTPLAVPATTDQLGIPYVGTGPTADRIRAASIATDLVITQQVRLGR